MDLTTIKGNLDPLRTQLRTGSGTEGEDCGALAVINLISWASRGRIGPDYQNLTTPAQYNRTVASWVRRVRRWSHNATGPMMVYGDVFEALTSVECRTLFRDKGISFPSEIGRAHV